MGKDPADYMKILFVSGVYPPRIGGPSAQTQHIAKGLLERGHQVQVITYGDPSLSGIRDGIKVTFIEAKNRVGLAGVREKFRRNIQLYLALHRAMTNFKPTVVQIQTPDGPLAVLASVVAHQRKIPTLIKYAADINDNPTNSQRGFEPSAQLNVKQRLIFFYKQNFQRMLFMMSTAVWATTPIFRENLLKRYHIPPHKIVLLPNFIDLSRFKEVDFKRDRLALSARDITILTVTRLVSKKGVDICIKALSYLRDLPVRLRIVGDGSTEYMAYLREVVKDYNLEAQVEFVGTIAPDQIASQYASANIFVLASYVEPFGIVLIEAMAAGVPVVATRVDGIPYVVEDGVSAHLFPAGDVHALVDILKQLIDSEESREALVDAGRRRVSQYDLESGLSTLISVYRQLATEQQPAQISVV